MQHPKMNNAIARAMEYQAPFSWIKARNVQAGVYLAYSQDHFRRYVMNEEQAEAAFIAEYEHSYINYEQVTMATDKEIRENLLKTGNVRPRFEVQPVNKTAMRKARFKLNPELKPKQPTKGNAK